MTPPTLEVPWSVAVLTFKHQINSVLLLKGGRSPAEVLTHIKDHTHKHCPEIEEIIKNLIEARSA